VDSHGFLRSKRGFIGFDRSPGRDAGWISERDQALHLGVVAKRQQQQQQMLEVGFIVKLKG